MLAAASLMPPALAETSPWYVGVAQSVQTDSNLYRIDSGQALPPGFSRSDTASITSLLAGLDQPIGRQRFYGSAALRANRYSRNGYLDGDSYTLAGGLDWSTVDLLSGTLGASVSRNQRRFNETTAPGVVDTRKNDESVQLLDASARIGVVTRMTLEAGLGQRRVGYSAAALAGSEYTQNRGSLGLRYRPGVATFGAALSHAVSDYRLGSDQVRRSTLDLTVSWPASGDSQLYARLSPTRVRYDSFSERNYSGVTGAAKWDWQVGGRLKLTTRLVHDVGQDSSFENFGTAGAPVIGTSDLSRTTTELRLNADYAVTAKINATAALGTKHRSLDRNLNADGQTQAAGSGSDNTTKVSLGLRWTPLRSVQVGAELGHERRQASGGLTQGYGVSTVNVFGQFTLQ